MIWIPLVLALLAEPIEHGDVVLRSSIGRKKRGEWVLRQRDLGPTAQARAMTFEDWCGLAEKVLERREALRGAAA